jgi:hypothetical protein
MIVPGGAYLVGVVFAGLVAIVAWLYRRRLGWPRVAVLSVPFFISGISLLSAIVLWYAGGGPVGPLEELALLALWVMAAGVVLLPIVVLATLFMWWFSRF